MVLLSGVVACTKPPPVVVDAGSQPAADAGTGVTEAKLDAWLRWQGAVMQIDGGATVRERAREEAKLLREVALTAGDVDDVEALVAAVMAERALEKMTAQAQLGDSLSRLSDEQRKKAEAALQATSPQGDAGVSVAGDFGADAVRLVLAREAEVTAAWEALQKSQGAEQ